MRKQSRIIVLGNNYQVRQFSASMGVQLICDSGESSPLKMLSGTEVLTENGWIPLSSEESVNRFVVDSMGLVPPVTVLGELCKKVYEENFGFLSSWSPVNIPSRFISKASGVMESQRVDPVISLVVMAGKATIREMEEYYSTADAFQMYDMIAIDNLNKALGSEAALNEAKSRNR